MSRAELAVAVNAYLWQPTGQRYDLDAHAIARYERGEVHWPSAHYRSGLRHVLDAASDAEMGFSPTPRGRSSVRARSTYVMPLVSSSISLGSSPTEYLARTTVSTPAPTRIGWTEISHVRTTTRAVAMSENLFGGGLSCEAAAAQLRWAAELLDVPASREVHAAIAEAVGNLGSVVAFSAFDIANYAAADRFFQFALWCAGEGSSWALRANTLAEMARKAAYVGERDEALSLIELAQVRSDRLTATARAMLATVHARILVALDRYTEALDGVHRADAYFSGRDPALDPPWLCYYDDAEHDGSIGKALIHIAQRRGELELATHRLERAISGYGTSYPRSRAFSRIRLATMLMGMGRIGDATPLGQQIVTDVAALRSRRLVQELEMLANAAEAHAHDPEVADLRHNIAALARSRT